MRKATRDSDEEKLNRTVEQVEELKKDVGEIKDMLLKLTSGINTTWSSKTVNVICGN